MARYSIIIREHGHDHESVLAQVDTNPQAVVEAAKQRTSRMAVGNRRFTVARYDHVYAVDNVTGERVQE
jgi:hypothetical protein